MTGRSLGERILLKASGAILGKGLVVLLLALGSRSRPAAPTPAPAIAQPTTGPIAEAVAAARDTCESMRQLCLAACPVAQAPDRDWNLCDAECAACAK